VIVLQIVTGSDMTLYNVTSDSKYETKPYLEHHSCHKFVPEYAGLLRDKVVEIEGTLRDTIYRNSSNHSTHNTSS
jgi:hypothetical protein